MATAYIIYMCNDKQRKLSHQRPVVVTAVVGSELLVGVVVVVPGFIVNKQKKTLSQQYVALS